MIFFPAVLFTVSVEVVLGGPWFVVAAVLSGWWQLFSGRGCILVLTQEYACVLLYVYVGVITMLGFLVFLGGF